MLTMLVCVDCAHN